MIVTFRGLVGHRRLLALLSRAIGQGRLPASLLFAGPRGVGKRATADALAAALNCLQPTSFAGGGVDACGVCGACRRIARGVHADVIVLEPGEHGHIRIDAVRAAVTAAGYRPFEGRRRVIVVDDADGMTEDAQGALLKTLEEPPSASTFVLVSSLPDTLLATIRSRCSRLRFGPLPPGEVADLLMRAHEFGEADARAAAAEADGSVGRALEAQTSDLVAAREDARRLLEQTARSTDPSRRIELARDLTGRKKTVAEERVQLASCLHALSALLRDLAVVAARADRTLLANADLAGVLEHLVGSYDARRSELASRAVAGGLDALARNVNPKVVADWVALRL